MIDCKNKSENHVRDLAESAFGRRRKRKHKAQVWTSALTYPRILVSILVGLLVFLSLSLVVVVVNEMLLLDTNRPTTDLPQPTTSIDGMLKQCLKFLILILNFNN